jgi:hypothetical protein
MPEAAEEACALARATGFIDAYARVTRVGSRQVVLTVARRPARPPKPDM